MGIFQPEMVLQDTWSSLLSAATDFKWTSNEIDITFASISTSDWSGKFLILDHSGALIGERVFKLSSLNEYFYLTPLGDKLNKFA